MSTELIVSKKAQHLSGTMMFPTRFLTLASLPLLATAVCNVCPDGSDVTNTDAVVPTANLSPDNDQPTCQEIQDFARGTDGNCGIYESYAGYCGCSGHAAVNACVFCGQGGSSPVPDKVTALGGATCGELETYSMFLPESECSSIITESILSYAVVCECPGYSPVCDFCAEGETVDDVNKQVGELTCGEHVDFFKRYDEGKCTEHERQSKVDGYRCGCRDISEFPECSHQENEEMCTTTLLDTVEEECECYNFCDGEFVGCEIFPGVNVEDCSGVAVSGCNYASAVTPDDDAAAPNLCVLEMATLLLVTLVFAL